MSPLYGVRRGDCSSSGRPGLSSVSEGASTMVQAWGVVGAFAGRKPLLK